MQMEETIGVERRGNYEGPAHAVACGRQQSAATNSERPFSHDFNGCLQPVVSSQSQMRADAASTSIGTVGRRAWLLEFGANCFRGVANLLWWVSNLLWWVANLFWWIAKHFRCVANHMSQLAKPAAGCEPRLENSTISQQPLLPAQLHGRILTDYDVFLNHRGPDVKVGFVAHLHEALEAMGLKSFLDKDSLTQGSLALASIDAALEVAKVHVAVVSVGYAESKHCLSELVAMLRSRKPVIPVFYDVEPAELRRVETGAFAKAFQKHRSRETADRVQEWADALGKLADITAFVFRSSDYRGNEAQLKQDVVDAVFTLLPRFRPLQVEKYLVGLEGHLEACVSAVNAMSDTRSVLGLFGVGGVGKTCLAKVVYNHLINHGKFKAACFLEIGQTLRSSKEPVKLGWLPRLHAQLLQDLLHLGEEKQKRKRYEYWFNRLSSLGPVLIVLDDIQDKDHFEKLIPIADALAQGSCIIATSRDQHLLNLICCDRHFLKRIDGNAKFYLHEVTPLGSEDSLKLFKWHVFGDEEPPEKFKALLSGVSQKYGGLPLALKVVGRGLHGKTSDEQRRCLWPEAMEALEYLDVRKVLEWSYDCLSKSERLMFVDIAFLCCGWSKEATLLILGSCKDCSSCCGNKSPHTSLDHLIDKSLVTLNNKKINMHALVQELGLCIGKEEGSHLLKEVVNFRVQNGEKVRALRLVNNGGDSEVNVEKFKEMPNLHFLVLNGCVLYGNNKDIFEEVRYLQLRNCTIEHQVSMPKLLNLVSLDMSESLKLMGSESALEGCPNLVTLDLSFCKSITSLPYSIGHLSRLEVLNLNGCSKLEELPNSIYYLTSLQDLRLFGCIRLMAVPNFVTRLACHIWGYRVTWKNSPPSYHILYYRRDGSWNIPLPANFREAIKIDVAPKYRAFEFQGCVRNASAWLFVQTETPTTDAMLHHLTLPLDYCPPLDEDKVEQMIMQQLHMMPHTTLLCNHEASLLREISLQV